MGKLANMQVLTVASGKGGVGKTTTTFELAYTLANRGRRVIALDCDPQASLTAFFGVATPGTIADVLTGKRLARDTLATITPTLSLMGASSDLVGAELQIAARPLKREEALRRALAGLNAICDVLIIDTPPALGLLTLNALVASDGVLVVTVPEAAALGTLRTTLDAVELVKAEANPGLKLLGVLATHAAPHFTHHAQAIEAMQAEKIPLLGASIPRTVRLSDMAVLHQPISDYDRSHPAALAYDETIGVIERWLKRTK